MTDEISNENTIRSNKDLNSTQLGVLDKTNDEIDLMLIFFKLWKEKWIVIGVTTIFAAASVIYALSINNEYRAEALVVPASSTNSASGGLAKLAQNFGGLASLAGINLGGAGGGNKTDLFIEILSSRKFISSFIERRKLLVPLMAGRKIDKATGELVIDKSMYNSDANKWIREVKAPRESKPSDAEAYREFEARLSISRQKKLGFISIGFTHYSPTIAKQWVTWLIEDLNEETRTSDINESQENIKFLLHEIKNTEIAEVKKIFYELIQEQTKTIMLAKVSKEYAFKTIDPAVVPELAVRPKRALIAVVGTLLGGIISTFFIFIRESFNKRRRELL